MISLKKWSKWQYDTSTSAGLTIAYVGGGYGSLVLKPPGGGRALYQYQHLGGGYGVGVKWQFNVNASVATYENASVGKIGVLASFRGDELGPADFTGACMLVEGSFPGGALTAMLLGIPPSNLQEEIGSDLFHFLMLAAGGSRGQLTMKVLNAALPGLARTYSKAVVLMAGVNYSGLAAGVLGSFGHVSLHDVVQPLVTETHEIPLRVERIHIRTHNTSRETVPINLPGDALFRFDKFDLKPQAEAVLREAEGLVRMYPGRRLIVEGHTDSLGTKDYNLKLSRKRADAVKKWMLARGIRKESEINAEGYGEDYPVKPNDTPAGRKLNRRVSILIP